MSRVYIAGFDVWGAFSLAMTFVSILGSTLLTHRRQCVASLGPSPTLLVDAPVRMILGDGPLESFIIPGAARLGHYNRGCRRGRECASCSEADIGPQTPREKATTSHVLLVQLRYLLIKLPNPLGTRRMSEIGVPQLEDIYILEVSNYKPRSLRTQPVTQRPDHQYSSHYLDWN